MRGDQPIAELFKLTEGLLGHDWAIRLFVLGALAFVAFCLKVIWDVVHPVGRAGLSVWRFIASRLMQLGRAIHRRFTARGAASVMHARAVGPVRANLRESPLRWVKRRLWSLSARLPWHHEVAPIVEHVRTVIVETVPREQTPRGTLTVSEPVWFPGIGGSLRSTDRQDSSDMAAIQAAADTEHLPSAMTPDARRIAAQQPAGGNRNNALLDSTPQIAVSPRRRNAQYDHALTRLREWLSRLQAQAARLRLSNEAVAADDRSETAENADRAARDLASIGEGIGTFLLNDPVLGATAATEFLGIDVEGDAALHLQMEGLADRQREWIDATIARLEREQSPPSATPQ